MIANGIFYVQKSDKLGFRVRDHGLWVGQGQ